MKSERHAWLQDKHADHQPTSQSTSAAAAEPEPLPSALSSTSDQHEALRSQTAPASRVDADGPDPALASLMTLCGIGASQQVSSVPASADMLPAQTGDKEDCGECIICWEAPANVILQPCGHLCVCSGCIPLLLGLPCPMCRGEVMTSMVAQA